MTQSAASRTRLASTVALVLTLAAAQRTAFADDTALRAPEPFSACDTRQAGAACSFHLGDRIVQGTCASAPDGRLACRPSAPPPPTEAVMACSAKQSGDGCRVAFGPVTLTGTCATFEDGSLACRPSGAPR